MSCLDEQLPGLGRGYLNAYLARPQRSSWRLLTLLGFPPLQNETCLSPLPTINVRRQFLLLLLLPLRAEPVVVVSRAVEGFAELVLRRGEGHLGQGSPVLLRQSGLSMDHQL